MKRIVTNNHRVSPRWFVPVVVAVAATAASLGCSDTTRPEAQGTISLSIIADDPGAETGLVGVAAAPVALDSVVVRVFRGGTGVVYETSRGMAWDGVSVLNVEVTCIAESDKKVSVELFEGPNMMHFGIAEQVDVVEGENTDVHVDAWDIFIDRIDVSPQLVIEGAAFTVSWSGAHSANTYLVQQSTTPEFEQQDTQSIVRTDTLMTGPLAPGAYYYRVAPLNAYVVGTFTEVAAGYVAAVGEIPPAITEVDPPEAAPGERVTLRGTNLDLPGSRVLIGNVECPVISATETELVVAIPLAAQTGTITVYTLMGSVDVPGTFVVDRIAYVTRTGQYSDWYVEEVAGELAITSGLAIVPLADVADRDMRVFDVVIVAHDVGTGFFEPDQDQMLAIAGSGAQVLAVGRGGQAYVSVVFNELNGLGVTSERRLDLYVPDGSLPIFQSPYLIAPQGPDIVKMSNSDQTYTGFDVSADVKPVYVTLYASLSIATPESFVLLDVVTSAIPYPVHNFYWGYEGDPFELTNEGRQCVLNILNLLISERTSVPAAPAR